MVGLLERLHSLAGLAGLIGLAWLLSEHRRSFPLRFVAVCVGLQTLLALLILNIDPLWRAVAALNYLVAALQRAARAGSAFIFRYLGGAPLPFDPKAGTGALIIAFEILPIVIVTAAVASLLWHWRVLPWIVTGLSRLLARSLGIGGAPALGVASTLFFGVVEAPLFVRAYLATVSRAELFAIMVAGLSTISGVVLVLYASLLGGVISAPAGHLITASLMSLPAGLAIARVMVPGGLDTPVDPDQPSVRYHGSLDAITRGTLDGLTLYLGIIAILITIFAFVNLADQLLAFLPPVNGEPVTLTRLMGWLFTPLVLLFGIAPQDAPAAGGLMGTKAVLNEFVAYQRFAAADLSPRSQLIMIYALCGFANLASIGMITATMATLAPTRRGDLSSLGLKAWAAGNLATGMTGAVAGLTRL